MCIFFNLYMPYGISLYTDFTVLYNLKCKFSRFSRSSTLNFHAQVHL